MFNCKAPETNQSNFATVFKSMGIINMDATVTLDTVPDSLGNIVGVGPSQQVTPVSNSIAPEALWQQTEMATLAGTKVIAFPAHVQLLHLALHAAYNHQFAFDLRSLCDILAETK